MPQRAVSSVLSFTPWCNKDLTLLPVYFTAFQVI